MDNQNQTAKIKVSQTLWTSGLNHEIPSIHLIEHIYQEKRQYRTILIKENKKKILFALALWRGSAKFNGDY